MPNGNHDEGHIRIPVSEYRQLRRDQLEYRCLQYCGVKGFNRYNEAMDVARDEIIKAGMHESQDNIKNDIPPGAPGSPENPASPPRDHHHFKGTR
jgi:hypothetical protein